MGHRCCSKQKVKRGLWSPEEDEKLMNYITIHGGQHGSWSSVPKLAGLQRCGKSCRLRWTNYLRPELKRGSFSSEEEEIIIDIHRILGNRWAQIAKHLPGRTDNEVKNFWNSCIKKKLISQGLDPTTHNLIKNNNIIINHKVQSPPQNLYFQQFPNNNIINSPFTLQNSDPSQALVTFPPPHDPMIMTIPKHDDACQNPNHVNDDNHDHEVIGAGGSSISSSSSSSSVPFMGDDDMSTIWGSAAQHHHGSSVPLYDDHMIMQQQECYNYQQLLQEQENQMMMMKMDGSFDHDMMVMMMSCGFDHHEQLMDQTFISMDDVTATNKWNF